MNKIGKTAMYIMGLGMIAGASYYAGLPKSKKEALKEKAMDMMITDKNFMDEIV